MGGGAIGPLLKDEKTYTCRTLSVVLSGMAL